MQCSALGFEAGSRLICRRRRTSSNRSCLPWKSRFHLPTPPWWAIQTLPSSRSLRSWLFDLGVCVCVCVCVTEADERDHGASHVLWDAGLRRLLHLHSRHQAGPAGGRAGEESGYVYTAFTLLTRYHFNNTCTERFLQAPKSVSMMNTQRSDLIIFQSVWNDMKKQNKLRRTKLCQCFLDASRNLPAKLPEKLCSGAPRAKLL